MTDYYDFYIVYEIQPEPNKQRIPVYGTPNVDQAVEYVARRARSSIGLELGFMIIPIFCSLQVDIRQQPKWKELEKERDWFKSELEKERARNDEK